MKKTALMRIFVLLIAGAFLFSNGLIAKEKNSKEITIKSNITNVEGKSKVTDCLKECVGILKTAVNLEDKTITVKYNADKTNPEDIRQMISKAGYDADDVKASKMGCDTEKKCSRKCSKTCTKSKPIE
jgi:periplasmic mercuric ion binding protein